MKTKKDNTGTKKKNIFSTKSIIIISIILVALYILNSNIIFSVLPNLWVYQSLINSLIIATIVFLIFEGLSKTVEQFDRFRMISPIFDVIAIISLIIIPNTDMISTQYPFLKMDYRYFIALVLFGLTVYRLFSPTKFSFLRGIGVIIILYSLRFIDITESHWITEASMMTTISLSTEMLMVGSVMIHQHVLKLTVGK